MFHASLIQDDAYQRILESCDFLDSVDLEAARFELGEISRRYWAIYRAQNSTNWEGKKGLSLARQHTMFEEAHKLSKRLGEELYNAYLLDRGDELEPGEAWTPDVQPPMDATPFWLESFSKDLRSLEENTEKLLYGLGEEIKNGKDPDLAFRGLIRELRVVFKKFTGKEASANRVRYDPSDLDAKEKKLFFPDQPTEFQLFVEACAQGFDIKFNTPYLYNKVQKEMTLLNALAREAKKTANTP